MINKIKILIADDHSMIRQGIIFLLEELDLQFEIFQASNFEEILQITSDEKIEIAILDVQFPEGNLLKILPQLRENNVETKILLFSGTEENSQILKYFAVGANGFISKLSEESEIKNAIQKIYSEGEYYSSTMQQLILQSVKNPSLVNPLESLTERELEIAELYVKGFGNLEIANELDVKQNTVSTYKKRLFDKLQIENIVELIEIMKRQH
ncbi:response regulator [Frigoriflavimonas asaccharolytica]|uniref:DNA-binding NarL/FixJ family response regulator n=1 Tax=Frigoriflavimonas asaccharolytica TaxID=2735899 RepID=A0A8J8K494_9FLAO|nr:response regulator transcription factor [Frigoriflavimonas asaccharolytica]NRS91455.1 DNA-binding NarL/FixJ family response regulator [Frigoriflavimonas asaccharolytica]